MSAPRSTHAHAALLMLGSTLGFGLMAIFIRLASKDIPTWEVAFFRNSFGFLALLPMLALPALRQPRPAVAFAASVHTDHLPRYVVRTAIGIASMFCGFWAIAHLPLAERVQAMRDPARRAAILAEENVDGEYANDPFVLHTLERQRIGLANSFIQSSPLDYEPGPEDRIGARAAAAGKTPEEFIYDHYTAGDGTNYNITLSLNFANGTLDHVHGLLRDPNVVSGLGDGQVRNAVISSGVGFHVLKLLARQAPPPDDGLYARGIRRSRSDSPSRISGGLGASGRRAGPSTFPPAFAQARIVARCCELSTRTAWPT